MQGASKLEGKLTTTSSATVFHSGPAKSEVSNAFSNFWELEAVVIKKDKPISIENKRSYIL